MYIFLDSSSIPLLRLDVERGNCPAIYTYISRVRMPMHLTEVLLITPTLPPTDVVLESRAVV